MQKYQDAILRTDGRPVSGASVTVTTTAGATPTLYSDNGVTALASNVLTSDTSGEYSFYAANGRYNLAISGTGITSETRSDVVLFDVDDTEDNDVGWADLTSSVSLAGVPASNAPVLDAFGPSGLREEAKFDLNEYCFLQPFHVNHDIVPVTCQAYLHVHWSTNGTNVQPVKWEMQVSRALGHDQANFGAPVSIYVQAAAAGTAWRHMITEVTDLADVLTLTEPDELVLVTLRRVTNGATDNTDKVFGLTVDLHYQTDRRATPNRAPNFYT